MPPNPRRELSSAYIVQDRSNQDEMARLHIQDQMITASMGGPLPEQSHAERFRRVLDVGCGTGDWLIALAKTSPEIEQLIGVDISSTMVTYARAQAQAQQVDARVQFQVMDALRLLEFPANAFDLVNERFAASFVRTWEWSKLFTEFQRVTRPGGVIRLTELTSDISYSSPALSCLIALLLDALSLAGHTFTSDRSGKKEELVPLLQRLGFLNVHHKDSPLIFRAGTPEGHRFYEDQEKLYRTILPFLRHWLHVPEDYETIYQQALHEMQQPDFVAIWPIITVWGTVPSQPSPARRLD